MLRYCSHPPAALSSQNPGVGACAAKKIDALAARRLITVAEAVCIICETTARELFHRQTE